MAHPADALTPREREIVAYLIRGMSNKQIAAALHITVGAVEQHLDHIYNKLGVSRKNGSPRMMAARIVEEEESESTEVEKFS